MAQLTSGSDQVLSTPVVGIMMAIIMALLSGAAGVYTELIMKKQPKRNVNVQNIYLYIFGALPRKEAGPQHPPRVPPGPRAGAMRAHAPAPPPPRRPASASAGIVFNVFAIFLYDSDAVFNQASKSPPKRRPPPSSAQPSATPPGLPG